MLTVTLLTDTALRMAKESKKISELMTNMGPRNLRAPPRPRCASPPPGAVRLPEARGLVDYLLHGAWVPGDGWSMHLADVKSL